MNTHSIIYTFIDSQNLNLGTGKDIYKNGKLIYKGWRLDFKKFRDVKKVGGVAHKHAVYGSCSPW